MTDETEGVSGKPPPWLLGWRAAKANFLPGSLVPLVMVAVLLAYFYHAPSRAFIEQMAEVKARWGMWFSALAGIVAGAFVPEIMRVVLFQRGRVERRNFENLLFTIPVWCLMGLCVDLLYRYQVVWFGDEAKVSVVLAQTLVDQFLYNPFFAQPFLVWIYDWRNGGYRAPKNAFSRHYYMYHVLPALIAGWTVWIPVVIVLYTLPEPVQVPLFALALSLWVMIFTWMTENKGR